MKRQVFNPYLPSWEYIPDGEPHVFGDRVYVYGSHDRFGGYSYCLNDYVCWSAPVEDLTDWRYEGIIYTRASDPANPDGDMTLFAPDVTQGPDGRYYLYYVLNRACFVSVAVCDTPAGLYRFYGYVHYPDGTRLGEGATDEPQFDPGVFTEGDTTYLYTGYCWPEDPSHHGPMVTVLGPDMLTITSAPQFVAPSKPYAAGSGYEGHEFYEASSMRKVPGMAEPYYFVYSSVRSYELCYATAAVPQGPFRFRGVLVSNCDKYIDSYKPADRAMFYGGNDHGNFEKINGRYYVFHHRHTNGTNFSRQGCAEPIGILPDGTIPQPEMTSCGLNGGPLLGQGSYSTHIACNLFCNTYAESTGMPCNWMDDRFPRITQDGPDGTACESYIANMRDGATAGFKYFDCKGVRGLRVRTRGTGGKMEVRTAWDGPVLGEIELVDRNEWTEFSAPIAIPDGVHALYFTYRGSWCLSFASFAFETE